MASGQKMTVQNEMKKTLQIISPPLHYLKKIKLLFSLKGFCCSQAISPNRFLREVFFSMQVI